LIRFTPLPLAAELFDAITDYYWRFHFHCHFSRHADILFSFDVSALFIISMLMLRQTLFHADAVFRHVSLSLPITPAFRYAARHCFAAAITADDAILFTRRRRWLAIASDAG
jgi:hypothetical protein